MAKMQVGFTPSWGLWGEGWWHINRIVISIKLKQLREKFKNKYRIESARMQNWDYGWRGHYFITICTRGRECYFGEIIEEHMVLSELGEIAESEWLKSPKIRPDMNLELDEYMIMPNHIHGIIQIGKNEYNKFNDENVVDCDCRSRDIRHKWRIITTRKKQIRAAEKKFIINNTGI